MKALRVSRHAGMMGAMTDNDTGYMIVTAPRVGDYVEGPRGWERVTEVHDRGLLVFTVDRFGHDNNHHRYDTGEWMVYRPDPADPSPLEGI